MSNVSIWKIFSIYYNGFLKNIFSLEQIIELELLFFNILMILDEDIYSTFFFNL